MSILPAALQGMNQAEARLDHSATRIASAQAPSGDTVDLSAEMVNLIQARTDYETSTHLVGVASEISKQLLNVMA
jgi:flagellar basal body rod protein FlgB